MMKNKSDLIAKVKEALGDDATQREATMATNAVINSLFEMLTCHDGVSITNFGVLSVKNRLPRKGRNPRTGEIITIPAQKSIVFKASPVLKSTINPNMK